YSSDRLADSNSAYRNGDILCGHWVEKRSWQTHLVAVGGSVGNALDELEELRRTHDRVRNRSAFDHSFLGHLRAEVTARKKTVGADDRKSHMMFYSCSPFRGYEVTARGLEEIEHGLIFPRRCVADVNNHLSTVKRSGQPLTSNGVDA